MKVLEFKVSLSAEQEKIVDRWLLGLRRFWNYCLAASLELEEFGRWDKESKLYELVPPPAPVRYTCEGDEYIVEQSPPHSVRYIKDGDGYIAVPYSPIVPRHARRTIDQFPEVRNYTRPTDKGVYTSVNLVKVRGWKAQEGMSGYSCPIPYYREPIIRSFSAMDAKTGFGYLNNSQTIETTDRLSDADRDLILSVPYTYRKALIAGLATTWKEYIKSRSKQNTLSRGKPRLKSVREPITTIIDSNPKRKEGDSVLPIGDYLKIPGLSKRPQKGLSPKDLHLKVPGLAKRWRNPDGSIPRVCVFKLLRRNKEWFVQLTGEVERSNKPYKRPKGFTGFDVGVGEDNWLTGDRVSVAKPQWDLQTREKEVRIQQEIDRKLYSRLILWLAHPARTVEDVRAKVPICSLEGAKSLIKCRTPEAMELLVSENVISGTVLGRLKYNTTPISNRIKILKDRLAKIKSKNAARRKAHQHKISTFTARKYNSIAIIDGVQSLKKKKQPVILEDENQFDHNGQSKQRGRNFALTDAAHGQAIALLEQKAAQMGRSFERVKPSKEFAPNQDCPACGSRHPEQKDYRVRNFECDQCGYYCRDRDLVAAVNLAVRAYDRQEISEKDLSKPALLAIRYRERRGSVVDRKV